MRIGLVDVPGRLGKALRAALAGRHEPVVVDDLREAEPSEDWDVVVHGVTRAEVPDDLDRATRGAWVALTRTRARRYVQLSSMRVLDSYDPRWAVDERWSPRPGSALRDLVPHLAELVAREVSRARPVDCLTLRLDDVVDGAPSGPTDVHLDDVVAAVVAAVESPLEPRHHDRWRVAHVVSGDGRYPRGRLAELLGGAEATGRAGLTAPPAATSAVGRATPEYPPEPGPIAELPRPGRIGILGAGGPLAVAAAAALAGEHELLLTDARPLAQVAAAAPQSPGAPRPGAVRAPHAERVVDVTDLDAVRAVAAETDLLVNCTVVRHDEAGAFRVNLLGAYHTMLAALEAGHPRVVHTGPTLVLATHPSGYLEDRLVRADAPARAGDHLYSLTKLLAAEVCRVFAEEHRIACPILHFCGFVQPGAPRVEDVPSFSVTWADGGRAVALAARLASVPEPAPVVHVLAPAPHGRYARGSAQRVLGWEPTERLDAYWVRGA